MSGVRSLGQGRRLGDEWYPQMTERGKSTSGSGQNNEVIDWIVSKTRRPRGEEYT